MRCLACNAELSNAESTRKYESTGEFIDLCNKCYYTINNDSEVLDNTDEIDYKDYVDIPREIDYP